MKKLLVTILLLPLMVFLTGCEDDENPVLDPPPAAPQGVYSLTGDGEVIIAWNGPYEVDLDYYVILRSFDPVNNYVKIDSVDAVSNPDLDLIEYDYTDTDVKNGTTYFYAVMSVDRAGQESDLSAEEVRDTPRPEGIVTLANSDVNPDSAGFIFALEDIVDTAVADISVMTFSGEPHLQVGSNSFWIQDMGWTSDFFTIGYAPVTGWSKFNELELIAEHTYVIYMQPTGNFAKVRARSVFATGATLEWGFQTDPGNPELKPVVPQK